MEATISEEAFYIQVGSNIRSRRNELSLSQGDLAKRLSISRVSLTNIENGKQLLSLYRFIQIAEILQTPIESLIGRNLKEREQDNLSPELKSWIRELSSGKA